MCKLWIKMNIKSKLTIRQMNQPKIQNIKQRTAKFFFFSHSAHGHTRFQIKNVIHTIASEIETEWAGSEHTLTATHELIATSFYNELKSTRRKNHCTITTVSLCLSLTYALTSVISFGSLCVRSHMLYVTEYVCVGMLLCACVHFGI